MGKQLPLVQAACLCDQVVMDKTDAPTIVRIVNRYKVEMPDPPLPVSMSSTIAITIFVSLRSMESTGKTVFSIKATRPDGSSAGTIEMPTEINAANSIHITSKFNITEPKGGMYWFDVYWGVDRVARIPAEITLSLVKQSGQSGSILPTETPRVAR